MYIYISFQLNDIFKTKLLLLIIFQPKSGNLFIYKKKNYFGSNLHIKFNIKWLFL